MYTLKAGSGCRTLALSVPVLLLSAGGPTSSVRSASPTAGSTWRVTLVPAHVTAACNGCMQRLHATAACNGDHRRRCAAALLTAVTPRPRNGTSHLAADTNFKCTHSIVGCASAHLKCRDLAADAADLECGGY